MISAFSGYSNELKDFARVKNRSGICIKENSNYYINRILKELLSQL